MGKLPKLHLRRHKELDPKKDAAELSRGQIIVLFAGALLLFMGIMGIAIDLSYLWVNEMRIQKAADAAALAGAVYLPNDTTGAHNAAVDYATRNGYTVSGDIAITANRDAVNWTQMDVTISAQIPTFFMQAFGVTTLTPSRTAHAQFQQPVPMGSPLNVFGVPTATDLDGNALNFWAAIQGPCTKKENGDPYATKLTTATSNNCSSAGTANGEYKGPQGGDPGAYDYAVKVTTAGSLKIELYDPEWCPRSDMSTDTGDSVFDSQNTTEFDTTFRLYAPSDTPYDLTDDSLLSTTTYPGDQSTTAGSTHSCSSTYVTGSGGNYTGKWTTFATVGASPGVYRLNIGTSAVGTFPGNGSNMFGIRATIGGGSAGVAVSAGVTGAQAAMSIFNNLAAGTSYIYPTYAGKTMEVDLFDPGDLNGTGVMSFMEPVGSSYSAATFSYRNSGTSLGTGGSTVSNVTSVTTASGGNSNFNGNWLVVTIKIPANYDGGTGSSASWWKIKYVISGGAAHDRTTWRVSIIDSPVHLVP